MKNLFLVTIALILFTSALKAQTSTGGGVSGTVLDTARQPVAYAIVKISRAADSVFVKGTATNAKGAFYVTNLKEGGYKIKISYVGLLPYSTNANIEEGKLLALGSLIIKNSTNVLKQVNITSSAPIIEQRIDMSVINVRGIAAVAPNALEVMKFAPGVMVSDNEDNISMSGKSGVDVYIDGKLTRLGGRSLTNFLKSLPTGTVDQMEVISNPSSKYDVQGNKAIINIKTKKNQLLGFNGNIDGSSSHAINNIYDIGADLNYRWDKFVTTGYFGFHKGAFQSRDIQTRQLVDPGIDKTLFINNKNVDNWKDPNARVSIEYNFDKNNSLGVLIEAESSTNGKNYTTDILNHNNNLKTDSLIRTQSSSPNKRNWNTYDLNYHYSDQAGTDIALLADLSTFTHNINNSLFNNLISTNPQQDLGGNIFNTHNTIDIFSLRGDYTKQFKSNLKIESGFKVSDVKTNNDFVVQDLYQGIATPDFNQTNNYVYKEQINSLYLNIGKSFSKFAFQGGVRVEQSNINGVSTNTAGNQITRPDSSYINLLPSLYLSYFPDKTNILKLSYTQKITRPGYESLNPFNYQLDLFTYHLGNPGLRVQSNSSLEFSYTYNNNLTFTAAYNHIKDYFTPVFSQVKGITYDQVINTGKEDDVVFNLDLPIKVTKWWTMNNKASVFYNSFKGQFYDSYLDVGKWAFSAYSSQRFVLPYKFILQVSGRYYSPSQQLIYYNHDHGTLSTSIGRRLFNDKATVRVGAVDLFYTSKQRTDVNFNRVNYTELSLDETRQVFVSFNYSFGNPKVKSSSQTSVGDTDEKRRAN
jgi:iron complex outermembrane receptor protein